MIDTNRPATPVAVLRGLRGRCPRCGGGRLFGRFLKIAPGCTECGQRFDGHRADDFPPYIVIFIAAHVIGYGIYAAEGSGDAPVWLPLWVWPLLTIALCLGLLQPVKGAVVGLQYGLGMHGFGAPAPADGHGGGAVGTDGRAANGATGNISGRP